MASSGPRSGSGRRARGQAISENTTFPPIKRWDGLSRTCRDWDSLRRDPELWERNGNCLIHLYGRGESRRGPSFKLPFSALLSANLHPLIERSLVLDGLTLTTIGEFKRWHRSHPRSTMEIYLPAPSSFTDSEAFDWHLAVRNLFAWVLGRPLVAEHLGGALVALRDSLHVFRSVTDNDDAALMDYLGRAGYMNMAEEPSYALAMLHLAETFQMKQLYANAFAHCVGMHGRLHGCSEHQLTSSVSRRLIKRARIAMNAQHLRTSDMLRDFLDDELSKAYLGIPPGTRAHLERFRCFLLSFYSTKMGYYPPKNFSAGLLRSMAADFDALYKLLVDTSLTSTDTMPPTHVGGICTLQLVQSFDERHELETRRHPLPQLPQLDLPSSARFKTWFVRGDKVTSNVRQLTLAALIQSSNWREDIFKNDLVRAYRGFEEESTLYPNKADRDEKVSVLDARKVRWILIYAMRQILCRATKPSTEVEKRKVSYHLNVPMEGVPPWQEKYELKDEPSHSTGSCLGSDGSPRVDWGFGADEQGSEGVIEIKPDIDYLALAHRRSSSLSSMLDGGSSAPSRSSSLSASLRRNSLTTSFRKLRLSSLSESKKKPLPRMAYHEIVVQGYGNGTNSVTKSPEDGSMMKGGLAGRSSSTASAQSNSSASTGSESATDSIGSTVDTLASTVATSTASTVDDAQELELLLARWGPQDRTPTRTDAWRLASSPLIHESSSWCEDLPAEAEGKTPGRGMDLKMKRRSHEVAMDSTGEPAHVRRQTLMSDMNGLVERLVGARSRDDEEEEFEDSRRQSDDWSIMQAFMDGRGAQTDFRDEMAQYADLGGLIDLNERPCLRR